MPESPPPTKCRRLYGKQKVNQWSDPEPSSQSEKLCGSCRVCHLKIVATDSRSMNSERNNYLKCRTPTTSKQTQINSADSNCNQVSLAMRSPKKSENGNVHGTLKVLKLVQAKSKGTNPSNFIGKSTIPMKTHPSVPFSSKEKKNMRELPLSCK